MALSAPRDEQLLAVLATRHLEAAIASDIHILSGLRKR